jgi:thiamine biosynthesis lipoprotein
MECRGQAALDEGYDLRATRHRLLKHTPATNSMTTAAAFLAGRPATARRWLAPVAAALVFVAGRLDAANPAQLARYEFAQVGMGMQFKLILYAAGQDAANRAAAAAFERIHELNGVLSDYYAASELSRLSDTAGSGRAVRVSPDLWAVLARSEALAEQSGGAFDITVGPYVKLWRRARREKEMPPQARMEEARAAVGYKFLRLDPQARTARLARPGMRLDVGGIAVGYAIDEAQAVLKRHGITRALVDGSGDIVVSDPPPGKDGWRIGVAPLEARTGPPSRYLSLRNCAVTTSGDAWQFVELDGKRYSHILDPRTGLGLTDGSLVVVVAEDGISADSLTKVVAVLGPNRGFEIVESYPHAAGLVVREVNGHAQIEESPRFKEFEGRE